MMQLHPRFWLLPLLAGLCLVTTTPLTTEAEQINVWFGTETPNDGMSRGIYHAKLNTQTGKLSRPQLAAEIDGPGFLTLHPNLPVLYCVGSVEGEPSVGAFTIDPQDGSKLTKLNSQPIGDGGATHLAVDPTGSVLLTAQYGAGSTALFPLGADGTISPRAQLEKHQGGSGVVDRRQDSPHAHWVGFSPDNRFAFVPDLGLDQVVIFRLNDPQKPAKLIPHGFGQCPPGGGPRHMKFHPKGKFVYVLNELASSVTVFAYDAAEGTMNPLQTIPALTEEQKAGEVINAASELHVHPNGRFVYSANRGHDTLARFAVDDSTGKLSFLGHTPIRGGFPRNFNIDPSGQWLLAAGRDSHTIAVFKVDAESGQLYYIREMVMVPFPICVLFGS
jgi:6-phosphogluconolactonase